MPRDGPGHKGPCRRCRDHLATPCEESSNSSPPASGLNLRARTIPQDRCDRQTRRRQCARSAHSCGGLSARAQRQRPLRCLCRQPERTPPPETATTCRCSLHPAHTAVMSNSGGQSNQGHLRIQRSPLFRHPQPAGQSSRHTDWHPGDALMHMCCHRRCFCQGHRSSHHTWTCETTALAEGEAAHCSHSLDLRGQLCSGVFGQATASQTDPEQFVCLLNNVLRRTPGCQGLVQPPNR
mmetsp:Transcript_99572/g.197366  ORF Transcript_99572/g.197366 Transcript_99572/m.197366 type:complete len:237 (-) Transcript_99572:900-1610(-)